MSSSALLSFFGWTFLPNFITTNILSVYYRTITRAGDPIPQCGTHLYARHYKRVHLSVITAYLLYTGYESYYNIRHTPTFYSFLSVPLTVDDRALKSQFRRLSIKYHPDKVGAQGEGYFVLLKQAYDVLSDPVKRFAYDRFGPDILGWKHCNSAYDYLVSGGTHLVPWYLGSLLFLIILTVLGKFEFGRYWRFFTFFTLLTFETLILTRPYDLFPLLSSLLPHPLLPFEQLILARKIVLTTFIAISQLGPLLQSPKLTPKKTLESLEPQLQRLHNLTTNVDQQASVLLQCEYTPFGNDPAALNEIKKRMEGMIVEQNVSRDPEVRNAIGRVIERRRAGAPMGARGTR